MTHTLEKLIAIQTAAQLPGVFQLCTELESLKEEYHISDTTGILYLASKYKEQDKRPFIKWFVDNNEIVCAANKAAQTYEHRTARYHRP